MTMDPGRILGRIEPQWSEHADGLRSMGSRRPQWLTLPVREAAEGQVLVGSDCTSLMICFVLRTPTMRGVYVRVSISEVDARGTTLAVHETILARREEGRALHVSFSLNENVSRVLVKVSNAWHDSELMIRDFECVLLSGERFPCASVGLTAASVEQSGELLLEILRYYDHYRERAARFSAQCIRLHDPGKIIDRLTGRPAEERPLPARRAQPEMPGSILRKLHGPVASSQE